MTADPSELGARLGVFYAAYLSGFVFGPPIAGLLTVIGDVRLPFVVLGLATALSSLGSAGPADGGRSRPTPTSSPSTSPIDGSCAG